MKMKYLLFTLLLVIGCGGGGGGGSGTAPTIDAVISYRISNGVPVESLVFDTGDEANVEVYATDSDRDMIKMFIETYTFVGNSAVRQDLQSIELPTQMQDSQVYYFLENLVISGPAGNFRHCFYIVDAAGRESDDFCINILVVE